ncbi:MAG: ferredoxin [candidate division Zixibacteria bacterium]|nr:ferredoxin [candidate division Zixibacteria bacterium]
MPGYRIEHDRENCIGCGNCVKLCPKFWIMGADERSDIIGATEPEPGWEHLEIIEKDLPCNEKAADECPVNVIHIRNLDTGKLLY